MSDPDDIERRVRELEAELAAPAARRQQQSRTPVQPSRRGRAWSLVIVVVVLACMAGAAVGIIKLAKQPSKGPAADNTPVTNGPTPSSEPTTEGSGTPGAPLAPSPTVAAPFLGTPAQSYANGAAGIVIPPAHAVGNYSAAEVAAAYRTTRRMLIAANLDPRTLRGGSPDRFASLLIPQQRTQFVDSLDVIGRTRAGAEKSSRVLVTSFPPGSTQLVGSVIKVHGAMHATTGMDGAWHVLRISADYLFVYAVERPGRPLTLTRIVVRYIVDDDFAAYDDPGGSLEPWWRLMDRLDAGALCGVNDGYVHPQFPDAGPGKVKPTGTPVNPYDQKAPTTTNRCQRTTGT